jgi:hypothetical protein
VTRPRAKSLAHRLIAAVLLLVSRSAGASESELEEQPPPGSAEELAGQLERQFEPPPEPAPPLPALEAALAELPPFLRDSTLSFRLRSRYLNRRRFDDDRVETWAGGGSVHFHSGWWADAAAVELEYFTSQRLKGEQGRDGARHLEPGQHGFGVLGVANAKLRFREWTLTAYRQALELPYVNGNDNRMVPNTFEAATLVRDGERADWIASYIWRVKPKDADDFVSIPALAGEEENRALGLLGVNWTPTDDTQLGAFGYYSRDVGSILYGEGGWEHELPRGVTGRLEGQLTRVQAVSDALLNDGERASTGQLGLRASASVSGLLAQLAATRTSGGGAIRSRFGSIPSYLDRMQHSFARANEDALGLTLTWRPCGQGAGPWSVRWDVTQGWNGENDGGGRSDRLESGLMLDFRPETGRLDGVWLRLRGSVLYDDEQERTQNEVRLELQYDFDLL